MDLNELLALPTALPSIPKVAATLLGELDQPTPDLKKINEQLSTDLALTARVLQLANSGFFRMMGQVCSVSEALALLKLHHVRTLVIAAAATPTSPALASINLHQFWSYSLEVAKLSRALAGLVRQNQAAAFTAGLLHAVGELVMHMGMSQSVDRLNARTAVLSLKRAHAEHKEFNFCYGRVSAGMARKWQLPQVIVDALEHQYSPFENYVYEPLAGVIHLAVWRVRAKRAGLLPRQLADSFPGSVGVAMGLDIDMVLQQDSIDWFMPTRDMDLF